MTMQRGATASRLDQASPGAMRAARRLANLDAIVPTGIAAAAAGALLLFQESLLVPGKTEEARAWLLYMAVYVCLLAFGLLLLLLSRFHGIKPWLPVPAAVAIILVTSTLAATDMTVSRDMSALAIGLVGGTVALRTRISFHLLRCTLTIVLFFGIYYLLSRQLPDLSTLVSSFVHLLLAFLVATVLERYAQRAFLFQAQLEERNRELQELSFRDGLTGLYNRRFLDESMERLFGVAQRRGRPLSLILLDVDHFKLFNDEFGHETGDRVLVAIGRAMLGTVRSSDTPGRFGGEEFLVILPDVPLKIACLAAGRILQAVRDMDRGDLPRPVTLSAGVVELGPDEDRKQLFNRADALLYRAKSLGRDRFES